MRSIECVPEETGMTTERSVDRDVRAAALSPVFTMKALQDISGRLHVADSLETLVDAILAGLEESFGFKYSMILVPTEEPGVLVTIATRGYAERRRRRRGAPRRRHRRHGGRSAQADPHFRT